MKYVAVTIGPIVKTLMMGKKTKEIWGASYLFSYMMREIIREFKDDHKVIIPYVDEALFDADLKFEQQENIGAGFFHDRCIFEWKEGDEQKLEVVVNDVIENVASEMRGHFMKLLPIYRNQMQKVEEQEVKEYFQRKIDELKKAIEQEEQIEEFLKAYFQIYHFEKEATNAIIELSPYLDMLELQGKVIPQEEINFLLLFMQNINHSFLKDDAFGTKRGGFESLPYIATRELHKLISEEDKERIFVDEMDDGKIYDSLNEILPKRTVKSYHKYIAIVQADGDNIGKVVEQLTEFDTFSKKLLEYAKTSNKTIHNYGGSVVYAGGDDLLFFAPVVCCEENLFDLLAELKTSFERIFKDEIAMLKEKGEEKLPSISFGISINYYKHPLDQALARAYENLEFKAKKIGKKNNITLQVLQHSGQFIETTLGQESESYKSFNKLLKTFLAVEDEKDILGAFHHTIRKFEELLIAIYKEPDAIENFFDNNFNEAHQEKYKEFTKTLVAYVQTIFSEEENEEVGIARLYTTLKLMKFLKGAEA